MSQSIMSKTQRIDVTEKFSQTKLEIHKTMAGIDELFENYDKHESNYGD